MNHSRCPPLANRLLSAQPDKETPNNTNPEGFKDPYAKLRSYSYERKQRRLLKSLKNSVYCFVYSRPYKSHAEDNNGCDRPFKDPMLKACKFKLVELGDSDTATNIVMVDGVAMRTLKPLRPKLHPPVVALQMIRLLGQWT